MDTQNAPGQFSSPAKGQTAWTETVFHNFCLLSNCGDGSLAAAGLITDKKGALCGKTYYGGNG